MFNRKGNIHRRRQPRLEQIDAFFLHAQMLRMHERHVEKRPAFWVDALIETAADRLARDIEPVIVLGEGARRIAIEIARKLVEQDDQRQRMNRMRAPDLKASLAVGAM